LGFSRQLPLEEFGNRNSLFGTDAAGSRPDHAITKESSFSSSIPLRKGTAEIAIGEVPIIGRRWLPPEKVLLFHYDRESCKFAGKFKSIGG
jgi:hypothetical protein